MIRLNLDGVEDTRLVLSVRCGFLLLLALGFLLSVPAAAQWAASPGETVRDAFGPPTGRTARVCRGACGVGCPSACAERTTYECIDDQRMLRIETFTCGTHQGCREHDDCLDRCSKQHGAGFDCDAQCHGEAVERYGLERAIAWAAADGPFDGEPITFEYTRSAPGEEPPTFRCPDGARLTCSQGEGQCLEGGTAVLPVFDSYQTTLSGAMRIANFRSGPLCGDEVCGQARDIRVTGEDTCDSSSGPARCSRYGLEFDYTSADPALPLECSSTTDGGSDDFIGGLIKKGFDAAPELGGDTFKGNEGLGELLGMFQKVIASAESPEDVQISMAPLGPDGQPIESQRVGSSPRSGQPPVPRTVDLPAANGHLVVPMYELAGDPGSGSSTVREVRCSHNGVPVLETTFRLIE